jgi:hypothetical protein
MMDDDECEAVSGMIGKGNQSTPTKSAPVTLCHPNRKGGMPATNGMSYGTASVHKLLNDTILIHKTLLIGLLKKTEKLNSVT